MPLGHWLQSLLTQWTSRMKTSIFKQQINRILKVFLKWKIYSSVNISRRNNNYTWKIFVSWYVPALLLGTNCFLCYLHLHSIEINLFSKACWHHVMWEYVKTRKQTLSSLVPSHSMLQDELALDPDMFSTSWNVRVLLQGVWERN